MRKLFAWLGVATLAVVCSARIATAAPNDPLKPYITMILDTSGSMDTSTGSGPPSCGGEDTRLDHARCAINKIINSFGDIVFALGRFRQVMGGTTTAATFPTGCCTAGPGVGANGGCAAGAACTNGDQMFELLTGLVDGSNAASARWVDLTGDTCTASGGDPEIWSADSSTPLEGSLNGAKRYWAGLQATTTSSGIGDSLAFAGGVMTLTDAAGLFVAADVGRTITIAGATTAANNGAFVITAFVSATQVRYANAAGVTQVFPGTWTIAPTIWPSSSAGFDPIVHDPTNTAFLPSGCNPNPTTCVTHAGTGDSFAVASGVVTLTDAAAAFVAADVGRSITIAGATTAANNGTFTITSFVSATQVRYSNPSAVAQAYPGAWSITSCCISQCRPYITILLTDGGETCGGNPAGANVGADALLRTDINNRRYRVQTKPIGFGIAPGNAQIEAIAHAGGAVDVPGVNEGYYVANEAELQLAISSILADAVRTEICNGVDDDCDVMVDEGFTLTGTCTNGALGKCLVNGTPACRTDGTNTSCNAGVAACVGKVASAACTVINAANASVAGTCVSNGDKLACQPTALVDTPPGTTHDAENKVAGNKCNGIDDDCDGLIDEGVTGCTCIVSPEQCNGLDDDCDGAVDDGIAPIQCGSGVCQGVRACVGAIGCTPEPCTGPNCCFGACSAPPANPEPPFGCDGLDNDCDGNRDGFTESCSNMTCGAGTCTGGTPAQPTCVGGARAGLRCSTFPVFDPKNNPGGAHTPASGCEAEGPAICICHPGNRTCPLNVGPPNAFTACLGEQEPRVEICNGLDDDCDGLVDETPAVTCTTSATCPPITPTCDNPTNLPNMGTCQPADCSINSCGGQLICAAGVPMCTQTGAPNDPTCDGIDDDCDGQVDEDWACPVGTDGILGTADDCDCVIAGQCGAKLTCQHGNGVVCQGTPQAQETCNCLDDNCNGQVDEGTLCPAGATCTAACQCAFHCSPGEFPCPLGKKCKGTVPNDFCIADPCFGVTCPTVPGTKQVCIEDPAQASNHLCVAACSQISCPSGQVCLPDTGECKPDDCSTFPDRCTAVQNCINGQCVANPCAGVTCPSDQYCVNNQCYGSCAGVDCPDGKRCRLGACEADPCGHPCPFGKACHDETGECTDDPCQFVQCAQGQICNPNNGGMCEDDACKVYSVVCPNPNEICKAGTCYDPSTFLPDAGVEQHVTTGGGGGCSTTGGGAGLLVGLAVLFTRRRRRGGRS